MTEVPSMPLAPHLERMYNERAELVLKIEKLSNFIASEMYSELPDFQKSLLIIQKKSMETYAECLQQRLIFS